MAENQRHIKQTKLLAKMAETGPGEGELGRCNWVDIDGNQHCNDFTLFQCQQVGGDFTPGARCEDKN